MPLNVKVGYTAFPREYREAWDICPPGLDVCIFLSLTSCCAKGSKAIVRRVIKAPSRTSRL